MAGTKNWLYLTPLVFVLITTELFVPFDTYKTSNAYMAQIALLSKIIPLAGLFFTLISFYKIKRLHFFLYLMPLLYFVYLVFESIYYYDTLFQFPHIFLKILDVIFAFAIYIFYKKHHEIDLTQVMNLILIMLIVRIVLNPSIVSVSSFVDHERILHSSSIYLILVPCIYFFNVYLVEFNKVALVKFLILFFFIVYFQHRTVWVAASVTFLFNLFLLKRQKTLDLRKSTPTFIILGFILVTGFALTLSYFPQIGEKISENFSNILNPTEDTTNTSQWRMLQYESYWPFVKTHFIEGMRLKGFELPIQFYHPDAGVPFFEDGTGHHFHSLYYDILFYFGLIGIVIYLIILIHPIYVALKYHLTVNHRHLSLISFSFSGMVFGVSYNLPSFYWTFYGLALAYLEVSKISYNKENKAIQERNEAELT